MTGNISFWTPSAIPLDAFTTFGVNAKPNSTNPIGYFGTGLKYAVAIILRHGFKFRLFVDGTEYEFYTADKDFRGKPIQTIRMRKRPKGIQIWHRSVALPFTTELGKNWHLWQAYRELHSNTLDEKGATYFSPDPILVNKDNGTLILVECPEVGEDLSVAFMPDVTFLDTTSRKLLFSNRYVDIYDGPSDYLYYRGVRVHDLRYRSRLTYDFKQGVVELSEDRTARNLWLLFHYVSMTIRREITDVGLLNRVLRMSDKVAHFEGHDLTYPADDYEASAVFREVARKLTLKGFTTTAVSGYYHGYVARNDRSRARQYVTLTKSEWDTVLIALELAGEEALVQRVKDQLEE